MKVVVVVSLFIFSTNAFCQDWTKTQTRQVTGDVKLRVGDKIPFSGLHNMLNYPTKDLKFSDHNPKLLLLDFWSMTCGPCIKSWPATMKLQAEFGKDLQVILVNSYEDKRSIRKFLTKRKGIDGFEMTLPVSSRDSVLWKNFPAGTLPRYAWIDRNGVIGAITGGAEVTHENVKKWITDGPFKMKNLDERIFYSVTPWEPIYVNGNGGEKPNDVFVAISSLTKGQSDNHTSNMIFYDSIRGYGISLINAPIVNLYGHAYNNRLREFDFFDYLPMARVHLIARDTSKYYGDGTLGGNTFNYQFISHNAKSRDQLLIEMQKDLDRYIGLDVKWEKQVKKCLVFTMFDSTLAVKRKSLGAEAQMRSGKIILDSVTVKDISTLMEMGTGYYRDARYPIVDETHYSGRIMGIREDSNAIDPITLDRILSKYGLHLKFEMREVDVLVLREPGLAR